jgi:hypothetical protein
VTRRVTAAVASLLALAVASPPARAWDPATTQAGLTQRALGASTFHKVLSRRLGRALGAFEPLGLHSRLLPPADRRLLWSRLMALDPEGGYRPDADGMASALAWVTAGAVLAETPPERGRNHFLDPRSGRGLDDGGGLTGPMHALRLSFDEGGSLRGLATGTVFDLTGKASLQWVQAAENDQGLVVFQEQLAQAVSGPDPTAREAALVRALMAMGGILAALQDAGEPAHVRNDFRAAFLRGQARGSGQDASFQRFVADQYGRIGVPAPRQVVRRPTFDSYFAARDGQGLANRTQRRFFSEGTLPEDVPVDAASTAQDVVTAARASLLFPQPTVGRLELRKPGPRHMMLEGRRALVYERLPSRVRFYLDEGVYADAAAALLPEVAAYAAGMVDHLLRGGFSFSFQDGRVGVTLDGPAGGAAEGSLSLLAEDAEGKRTSLPVPGGSEKRSFQAGQLFQVDLPAGTRRVAAVLRGTDSAGALVAVGEARVP